MPEAEHFREHGFDTTTDVVECGLSESDLKELGLTKIRQRKAVKAAIEEERLARGLPPSSTAEAAAATDTATRVDWGGRCGIIGRVLCALFGLWWPCIKYGSAPSPVPENNGAHRFPDNSTRSSCQIPETRRYYF